MPAPAPAKTIAVVGDSNSTGFSGTLEAGLGNGSAWAASLPADRFTVAGGWAVDGSTTTVMADAAAAVPAADIVVILGGTNDLAWGEATETTLAEVVRIADTVTAGQIVIAAIPPFDALAQEAIALNAALADLAQQRGWVFVDPWREMRQPDGTWVADYRTDGIHTSPDGYARAGQTLGDELSALG